MADYRYLFGPVPSRRFGRSLGVDLTPFKTCSLNCVFCQLGRTTDHAIERREYVPTEEVLAELDRWLASGVATDYVTLSGSGEPTLHTRFGDVLDHIRTNSNYQTALLTNGTLLHLPEVRADARRAHVVKCSLGAWDQDSFQHLNLPHAAATFEKLVAGERALRDEYEGELWIEVMVVQGINSARENMAKIAAIAKSIRPDHIHLNTVIRPPAESTAQALPRKDLEALADLFEPRAEVIADYAGRKPSGGAVDAESIFEIIRRRPCTAMQIAEVSGAHPNEVSKYIGELLRDNRIQVESRGDDAYYKTVLPPDDNAG